MLSECYQNVNVFVSHIIFVRVHDLNLDFNCIAFHIHIAEGQIYLMFVC